MHRFRTTFGISSQNSKHLRKRVNNQFKRYTMAHPQVSIEYLLELEEVQKQMPTLRLWQLDGVLRGRAGHAVPTPTALVDVAPHAPAEERPLQALSVAAEPYAPAVSLSALETKVQAQAQAQQTPTFAEIASLRPKQAAPMPVQAWITAAAKAVQQQQQQQQQHTRIVAVASSDVERRSPSRLEVTGPRRGRDSPA